MQLRLGKPKLGLKRCRLAIKALRSGLTAPNSTPNFSGGYAKKPEVETSGLVFGNNAVIAINASRTERLDVHHEDRTSCVPSYENRE